jgi:hypothetical protein
MKRLFAVTLAATALSAPAAQVADESHLRQLFEQHRWFDLRDAVTGRAIVRPLYRGAVAAAFNRTEDAETLLGRAVGEARTADEANEARELLAGMYLRLSRSVDLVHVLDEMRDATPMQPDVVNMRDAFAPFLNVAELTVHLDRRPFRCTVARDGISLPATINGKPITWLFDSGFSNVATSEAQAQSLGLRMLGSSVRAGDFERSTGARVAVADRLRIGRSELRHVPVMVYPDANPMWHGRAPGRQGILALPVALALGGLRWNRTGRCEAGGAPAPQPAIDQANLAFDSDSPPATRGSIDGAVLEVSLDTGAQSGSQFWQRFAADFPAAVERGTVETSEVQAVGGRREERITVIPRLQLQIAGFDVVLARARVFAKPGDGLHHANIGMDVFNQASAVTLDFERMRIELR